MNRTEVNDILRAVAEKHGCATSHIRGVRRLRTIVAARREAAHILRGRGLSYPEIGKLLGGKHHTSVMNLLAHHAELRLPPEANAEAIRLRAIQAKASIDGLIEEIDRQLKGAPAH